MNQTDSTGVPGIERDPAEWQRIAERVKPYLHLYRETPKYYWIPDEKYRPSSVGWYLDKCSLRSRSNGGLNVPATDANLTTYNGRDYYLQPGSPEVYRGEDDPSRVPFYVHVAAVAGTVVELQYYFFYPYNGPLPLACSPLAIPYVGAHEGDWEGVKVRLDLADLRIRQVYYAAHGSEGRWVECSTDGEGTPTCYQLWGNRPVVYAAFHSHACYPDVASHFRVGTCDYCSAGLHWDGPVELVAVDPVLLPAGVSVREPAWLNWEGRWGSTRESVVDSWFSNSPDGPKISSAWRTHANDGDWAEWGANLTGSPVGVDGDFSPAAEVIGPTPLVSCAVQDHHRSVSTVWALSRPGGWRADRIGDLPAGETAVLVRFAADGNATVFALAQVAQGGRLYASSPERPGDFERWLAWTPLPEVPGEAVPRGFAAAADRHGRVHVLVPGTDGSLYDIVQTPPGSPPGWQPPAVVVAGRREALDSVVTTRRDDGTLAAVYAAAGRAVYLTWSDDSGEWTQQGELPPATGLLLAAVVPDPTGPLVVLALEAPPNPDKGQGWGIKYCLEQDPGRPGSWSPWAAAAPGQPAAEALRAAREADGTVAALALEYSRDKAARRVLMSRFNRSSLRWGPWVPTGTRRVSELGPVFRNPDGRLEAIASEYDENGRAYVLVNNYETTPFVG